MPNKAGPDREEKGGRLERLPQLTQLLDLYGPLLTQRQREALQLSFEEDWSLSEIAELHRSSRQAAHSLIERGQALLEEYEGLLRLAQRQREREELLAQARSLLAAANLTAGERTSLEEILCRL